MHKNINRITALSVLVFLVGCSRLPYTLTFSQDSPELQLIEWNMQPVFAGNLIGNGSYPTIANIVEGPRPVIDLYRQNNTHGEVVSFFTNLAGSEAIARVILHDAERSSIPALVSFALAWGESTFDIYAKNGNPGSVDRGLFQLNSRTFYWLEEDDFYDPHINSYFAHNYLAGCLIKSNGDYKTALAMYNAGAGRVLLGRIPETTQRYVKKVSSYYESLRKRYKRYILDLFPA